MILAQFLFLLILVGFWQGGKQTRLEQFAARAVDLVEFCVPLHHDCGDVVSLPILILAEDEDAVASSSEPQRMNLNVGSLLGSHSSGCCL